MKYPAVSHFIQGAFVVNPAEQTLPVVSPLDGALLSTVPLGAAQVVDEAVAAAKAAFPTWSKTPIKERVQVFFQYKQLLEKNLEELAALISEENGKTLVEAIAEVEKSIELTESNAVLSGCPLAW